MLLYTRRALPKIPKKRSRAGCEYCRIKKKKCDEGRPNCERCRQANAECIYALLRPRKRRTTAQSQDEMCSSASTPPIQPTHTTETILTHAILGDEFSWSEPYSSDSSDVNFVAEPCNAAQDDDLEMVPAPSPAAMTKWSPTQRTAGAFYATPYLELNMPLFSEFTSIKGRRSLLNHFTNVMSHLIVLREDDGNPFQQLVLPMSRHSPAVASAIYALSSAHLEFRGVEGDQKSVLFHTEAARNLANLIDKGVAGNQNELLAAVILLIYYEVLVHREQSHIVDGHLRGAMALLNIAPAKPDPTRAFLERAFRFYDVIAALSFGSKTLSEAPAPECVGPFLPVDSRGASRPVGSADALLGMATSLWPIIHRLSNLGTLKDELVKARSCGQTEEADRLHTELDAAASSVEAALAAWKLELGLNQDEGADGVAGPLGGIVSNALAYRHSALVHLHRNIYGASRNDAAVQEHAHKSLQFCMGTVESAGPKGALLWPLFVAACEAQTPEDRDLATGAFQGIGKQQGMANIEQSWLVVQEVWRRADAASSSAHLDAGGRGEGGMNHVSQNTNLIVNQGSGSGEEDLWRQVCRDMGLAVVFG